ncbi:hypothetical protein ACJIZ3_011088 [Penstemon smallii]|uniref:Knottins-like domain-containing protein n=1 Tax=Penstemon smallii TaxID=265156 RepID=A0ABD3UJT6_9LAMI
MGRFSTVFLVLVLLLVTEIGQTMGQGRTCPRLSNNFSGACFFTSTCARVCRGENFPTGGYCNRLACYCYKPC